MQFKEQKNVKVKYNIFFDMKITDEVGKGAFGYVFLGKNIKTGKNYAIKIDKIANENSKIEQENIIYKQLEAKKKVGFPKIFYCDNSSNGCVIAMELLGTNLNKLFKKYHRFSAYTTSTIGIQMIDRIHSLHSCNFIYRDIKPDNFLIGKDKKDLDKIYLIDFGLSTRFRNSREGLHIPYREGKNLIGTPRYVSINTHLGIEQSRRDDIEALAYLLIYFMRGDLPWQDMPGLNTKEKLRKIGQGKIDTKISELCKGCPKEMEKFVQRARDLKFDERPNYDYFKKLLYIIRGRELNERKEECFLEWEKR